MPIYFSKKYYRSHNSLLKKNKKTNYQRIIDNQNAIYAHMLVLKMIENENKQSKSNDILCRSICQRSANVEDLDFNESI